MLLEEHVFAVAFTAYGDVVEACLGLLFDFDALRVLLHFLNLNLYMRKGRGLIFNRFWNGGI
jgi:hypothetical protein